MKEPVLLMLSLLLLCSGLYAQTTRQIRGKVYDVSNQEKLPGANIVIKGTSIGTTSDANGEFLLSIPASVPLEGLQLVVAYIGFKSQTIDVGNRSEIEVAMQTDEVSLGEVVVIGYGEINRRDIAGAIVSVKPETLLKVPSNNVMESLQGRVPGMDITRSSGDVGAGINVTVRGNRSITANNNPLFIVDGIPYSNIQDINPNDIESMEVLKDASSTAIYGSRGANGVIIVTTKKAKTDQLRISFNTYVGTSRAQIPEFNDGAGYVAQRLEARRPIAGDGSLGALPAVNSVFTVPFLQQQIASNNSTDWISLFAVDGFQQNHNIGVASGSAKTSFYLSLDYFQEEGLLRNTNFDRYTMRINLDHSLTDKIKIGLQNQITYSDRNRRADPLSNAGKINPLFTPYDANGNLEFLVEGRFVNPLYDELPNNYVNEQRVNRLLSTLYLDAKITPALTFRSNAGVTLSNTRQGIFRGSNTVDRAGSVSQAIYETDKGIGINWENILTYKKNVGDHSFGATGITTLLTNTSEEQGAQGANQLLNSQLFYALGNATEQVSIFSGYTSSTLLSFTGRVNYSYKGKYVLTFTGRGDGASQLAEGRKWAFFPSASFAWQIIDEPFMASQNTFSNLKLRLGYGRAGNSAVRPYSTASLITRIPFSFDETSAVGNRFNLRVGNRELGWELSNTINVGLDFGFFKDRLTGTIDLYDTRTSDLLLARSLPPSSGVGSVIANIGKTRNRGIELALNAKVITKSDFNWDLGMAWFANKEEITELASGQTQDLVNRWFVGQPTVAFYDFEKVGIWQTAEAAEAARFGRRPGDIKVKDQNNDGVIDNQDRIVLGSTVPKWNANLNSDFSYKNFDFSIQFFARMGQMMDYGYAGLFDPQGVENSIRVNYWTPDNPTNDYPRPNASLSRTSLPFFSTLQYRDASFIKLRALTLGYSLPKSFLSKIKVSRARLYATGRNLFILTEVENYDPERGGPVSNPIPRLWVTGLNIEF